MHHRYATVDRRTDDGSNRLLHDCSDGPDGRPVGTGTVVVGSAAAAAGTAKEGRTEATAREHHDPLVVLPMRDYRPGLTVRVLERLPAPIVVRLLRLPNGDTVSVLKRPDEYTGYVARSEFGPERVHAMTVVFTRESLETETRYAFEDDATVFSTRLNLFRVTVGRVDDDAERTRDEPGDQRRDEGLRTALRARVLER
ncbi:hypothetical protein [Halopiger djelfimassiliensis]|uniref:hypothetical protein n=1 Tax=Halopiger djelfimassiliensis TaxID=1293047 RepID=UPI00067803CA|nr:hypothetical protein [Halopiger djelfimassiliensis]